MLITHSSSLRIISRYRDRDISSNILFQVLVIGGRRRDLIGVRANIVRGKYDCAPTKKAKA